MTFQSGPFNIEQGNTASFVVEFFDSANNLSVPPSASMTVTYINTSGSQQSDNVILSPTASFFTGTWSSTSAALGLATWSTATSLSSVQIGTGQIRIIQRQGL